MNWKKQNNQGVSLIELVVSVAILSVVVLGACTLVVFSSKFFRKATANASAMTESQLMENTLNNLIVDTQKGLEVGTSIQGVKQDHSVTSISADQCLQVTNKDKVYLIVYDGTDKKMFYLEKKLTDANQVYVDPADPTKVSIVFSDEELTIGGGSWELFAEKVSAFQIPLIDVDKHVLAFTAQVEEDGVTVDMKQNIMLRNDVKRSADLGSLLDESTLSVLASPYSIDVRCGDARTVLIAKDADADFTAYVYTKNGYPVASDKGKVNWTVTTSVSAADVAAGKVATTVTSTSDNTAKVTIGTDEGSSILVLTATSDVDPSITGTATIIVPTVESIKIKTPYYANPAVGENVSLEAIVLGKNIETSVFGVKWQICDSAGNEVTTTDATINENTGVLHINDTATVGTVIYVQAYLGNIKSTNKAQITVASESSKDRLQIAPETGGFTLNRGESKPLKVSLDGSTLNSYSTVTWSITNNAGLGNKVHISSDGTLIADKDIDYTKSYTISVKCKVVNGLISQTVDTVKEFTIPVVQLLLSASEINAVRGTTTRIGYSMQGLVYSDSQFTVTSNPSISGTSGSFIYCNSKELVVTIGSNLKKKSLIVSLGLPGSSISSSVKITLLDDGNVEEPDNNSNGMVRYIDNPTKAYSRMNATQKRDFDKNVAVTLKQGDLIVRYYKLKNDDKVYIVFNKETYYWNETGAKWVLNK